MFTLESFNLNDKKKLSLFLPFVVEGIVLSDFNWYQQVFSNMQEIKTVDSLKENLLEVRFKDSVIVHEICNLPEPEIQARITKEQIIEAWNILKNNSRFEEYTEFKDFLVLFSLKLADESGEGIFSFLGLASRTSNAESKFIDLLEEILV